MEFFSSFSCCSSCGVKDLKLTCLIGLLGSLSLSRDSEYSVRRAVPTLCNKTENAWISFSVGDGGCYCYSCCCFLLLLLSVLFCFAWVFSA